MNLMGTGSAIFQKLVRLGIIDENGNILFKYMKFQVPNSTAMMDLNLDRLDHDRISIAHNTIQNGDVMADPDQEVVIDPVEKLAFAYTFQNDFVGYYDNAFSYSNDDYARATKLFEHSDFLNHWLDNIFDQGYELVKTEKIE